MSSEWEIPMQPEQREAAARRRRRYLWGTAGGLLGLLANLAVLVMLFIPLEEDQRLDLAFSSVAVVLLSAAFSLVLLIAGGLLCIGRRSRPFGVGMLIGTAAGLISTNGVCFAVLAVAS